MPRQRCLDVPGGDPVTYDVVTEDGYRMYPFFDLAEDTQKNFENLHNKKCREDDILLNSYPKTGTHWLWEMVTLILQKQAHVTSGNKDDAMLEAETEANQNKLPSPRVINTHVKYRFIPKEAREKKIKCILLARNPKDTVVSFYNHTRGIAGYQYDGKFGNFLDMFMRGEVDFGSYPEYLLEWQRAIRENPDWPVHVLFYEDLKQNTFQELRKLRDYLGSDIDDDLLMTIADNCQIDKMRESKDKHLSETQRKIHEDVFKDGFKVLRKGQVGGWKHWFTVAQNKQFDHWWAENTQQLDMFSFRYT